MSKNIVRAGRLFNPEGVESRQVLHCSNSLVHLPYLICIEHQDALRPDLFAHDACTAQIVLQAQADLHLEVPPAISQRFAAELAHLLIAIAGPTGAGCIGGKPCWSISASRCALAGTWRRSKSSVSSGVRAPV